MGPFFVHFYILHATVFFKLLTKSWIHLRPRFSLKRAKILKSYFSTFGVLKMGVGIFRFFMAVFKIFNFEFVSFSRMSLEHIRVQNKKFKKKPLLGARFRQHGNVDKFDKFTWSFPGESYLCHFCGFKC